MNSQTMSDRPEMTRRFQWWHGVLFLALAYVPGSRFGWREELFPGFLSPPLRPPGYVFPVIWAVINICVIWAGLRILNNTFLPRRSLHLSLQGLFWLNFVIFPYFFFGVSSPVIGGILTLMIFVVALIEVLTLWRSDRMSALLMMPLLAWATFAAFYVSLWQALYNPDPYLGLPALIS